LLAGGNPYVDLDFVIWHDGTFLGSELKIGLLQAYFV
jgi:hypothetical protein